jgi:hypothetical protein
VPGLTEVSQTAGQGQVPLLLWVVVLLAGLTLGGLVIGLFALALRRRRRSGISDR